MDTTYEAITNYLDEKQLEAKDLFIEEYVTDPLTTPEDKLVVERVRAGEVSERMAGSFGSVAPCASLHDGVSERLTASLQLPHLPGL